MAAAGSRTERPNKQTLTVEQRANRIAELYRLKMKFEDWFVKAVGRDVEATIKSRVLNGAIKYIDNRIEYLANSMNPVIEISLKEIAKDNAKADLKATDEKPSEPSPKS